MRPLQAKPGHFTPECQTAVPCSGFSPSWSSPTPPTLTRSPGYRRGPDRSLTVAVEELEPVVNPVIGLFAVGFLGCSRTQRHKRCRRGRHELVDQLRGIFPPSRDPRPGSRAGPGAAEIAANYDPSAALPTLTAPSNFPENFVGRAQAIPWLGPAYSRGRSCASSRGRGRVHPGALDPGVRSRARLSPAPGSRCELFWSRTS